MTDKKLAQYISPRAQRKDHTIAATFNKSQKKSYLRANLISLLCPEGPTFFSQIYVLLSKNYIDKFYNLAWALGGAALWWFIVSDYGALISIQRWPPAPLALNVIAHWHKELYKFPGSKLNSLWFSNVAIIAHNELLWTWAAQSYL